MCFKFNEVRNVCSLNIISLSFDSDRQVHKPHKNKHGSIVQRPNSSELSVCHTVPATKPPQSLELKIRQLTWCT